MPLKIDISDVAIEKKEAIHQLHIWGVQTSLWKNNCVVCGKDTDAARIRCGCGEGFFCSPNPLKDRPSPNHRRAVIFHSGAPNLSFVWIEIKGSHLVIDHPSLDECFGYPGIGSAWLDLAVVNPAVQSVDTFEKIGHGLAIGFSSTMLDPDVTVDAKWRNKALTDISGPGNRILWPGPLVFFCYGYDLSDYVKVDLTQPDNAERGAEAGMSKLDIWNELGALRLRSSRFSASETDEEGNEEDAANKGKTPDADGNIVWKWKVKEHGTSMRILDLVHRDLNTVLDYISCTELNAIPSIPRGWPHEMQAIHIQNVTHPGYAIKDLWSQVNPLAQMVADEKQESSLAMHTPNGETVSIKTIKLPLRPRGLYPVLGAFAVGLRWLSISCMDINPPFRGNLPTTSSTSTLSPFMDLAWTVHFPDGTASPSALLSLHMPHPTTCDSLIVTHSSGGSGASVPVVQHHARALLKYLAHTDPRRWARRGRHGFERYWAVYARVDLQTPGAPGPYSIERRVEDLAEFVAAPEVERVLAHVTLEGLGRGDEGRRGEIAERRRQVLRAVGWYRREGGWVGKGVDGGVEGCGE
ncbi:hypothetical protein C8A01DRAFT_18821 [Parachaetomium inaequale]|uniref:Uncharacterized protein n=1 Tax=Parachaetomium inaequale TaxID=2588326 RepID=A0AAN6SN05_9PEZI|nr:hypothetical protein C8A01DRAFT_18821 [Parachaetomium inaequale]